MLTGAAPVSAMQDYPQTVTAYTRGLGRISCTLRGYEPCKNQQQVVEALGYDPEADLDNSPDSIFCSHGAGINVKWNEVPEHMHLPSDLEPPVEEPPLRDLAAEYCAIVATDKELMQIFERTYIPSAGIRPRPCARPSPTPRQSPTGEASPAPGRNICWWTATISSLPGTSSRSSQKEPGGRPGRTHRPAAELPGLSPKAGDCGLRRLQGQGQSRLSGAPRRPLGGLHQGG